MPKRKFSGHFSSRSKTKPWKKQNSRQEQRQQRHVNSADERKESDLGRDHDDTDGRSDGQGSSEDEMPASRRLLSTFERIEEHGPADGSEDDAEETEAEVARFPADIENDGKEAIADNDLDNSEDSANDEEDSELEIQPSALADPFIAHFETLLPENDADGVKRRARYVDTEITLPSGNIAISKKRTGYRYQPVNQATKNAHVKENLVRNIHSLKPHWSIASDECFDVLNHYQDLFHFQTNPQVDTDYMRAVALHILNHVLKTRNRIISHNSKLGKKNPDEELPDFRDQGYSRPKVLILMPFRHRAFKLFEVLCELLNAKEDTQVMNRKRFIEEFGWSDKDPVANSDKPEDFRHNFTGNTDDCFRIGLRMIIGDEGEKQHEYDFLSSIEILFLDQADVFLMQNWEHVLHILKHLHRIPTSTKNIDFSRVRPWILNGWGALYRQTIMLAAFRSPELQAVVNRHCFNHAGSVTFKFYTQFTALSSVVVPLPHTFEKIPGSDAQKSSDARFRYFCDKVLPGISDHGRQHTLIFIPSYFDFVRLRNHFKREETSFVQLCEYTPAAKVTRARDLFFHGKKEILLYTERVHFYRRYRIRGIRHIIFYEAPHYSQFYSELCNMLVDDEETKLKEATVTCLFSRFDLFKLGPVVGNEKAAVMVQNDKPVHVFVTEPPEQTAT